MGQQKNWKYYLMIFGIAMLAIVIYLVINWIDTGVFDVGMLIMAVILPTIFTMFLIVFDKLFGVLFPSRQSKQTKRSDFELFLIEMNTSLNEQASFSIQEYRKLQDNERFQKTLKQLYTIKTEGETEDLSLEYMSKKFKKSSVEYQAVQIIINELKKLD